MQTIRNLVTTFLVAFSFATLGSTTQAYAHLELEECSGTAQLRPGDSVTKHSVPVSSDPEQTWQVGGTGQHFCEVNCNSGEGRLQHISGNGHQHPHAVVYKCKAYYGCEGTYNMLDGWLVEVIGDGTYKRLNNAQVYCKAKCDLGSLKRHGTNDGNVVKKCHIDYDEEYECKGAAILFPGDTVRKIDSKNWVYEDSSDSTVFCAARCRYGRKQKIDSNRWKCVAH